MDKKLIKQFLEFRSKFTKREWFELNRAVESRLQQKADQLELDDLDIQILAEMIIKII